MTRSCRSILGPALLLGSLAAASGCFILESEFGTYPTQEQIAAIVPGQTRFETVLALLGPPEEYRYPTITEAARSFSAPEQRIRDERRVFDLSTMTYVREEGVNRILFLLVFRLTLSKSRADRLVITLDQNGVVQDVAMTRAVDES